MELTKLEIKGFKSFGDKIVINFDSGITGIVGPNGCGKSNVVDAIRWVLGEQKTRALRSDKMENVIFNGTKNRKATQLAEVSLTFNNTKNLLPTEYTQVTVTRRYYRSGESEYLLNGVTCRLKDITNLFMDTGIASNTYAIIELSMVDDILNDKDNSRRALFEEAAGISKFRNRKKDTLKKLENTDADLERVDDLLYEIQTNLKDLEKQAKQAEKYYKAKEDYKKISIALAKLVVERQQANLENLNKQLEQENDKKLNLNTQISEKEAYIEQAKNELINKEKVLKSRQETLNEHVSKISKYENEKHVKNERLRFLKDRSTQLEQQIETERENYNKATENLTSLKEQKESAEKVAREQEETVNRLQEELEVYRNRLEAKRAQVNTTNEEYKELQNKVFQLNKTLEIKQNQLSGAKQELEKASADTSAQNETIEEYEGKVGELAKTLEEKNNQLENIQASEEDLQSRIDQTNESIEQLKEDISAINREKDAIQNEYDLTKSLVDNLEGFPEAIKFIRKNLSWGKDAPLLSDILTCEEKYKVTIENFLGGYMNYYVVENKKAALEAVNLLSNASKGKANFFILDNFTSFYPTGNKSFENALPATSIVEYDPKYENLINFILDKVYILNDEYHKIPDDTDKIFITQDGKVIQRPYSISGGSVGLFEGKKIGRAKNLEKLSKQLTTLSEKLNKKQEELNNKQKELASLKNNSQKNVIESLQQEINRDNQEYISHKTKLEQVRESFENNTDRRTEIETSIENLRGEIAELEPQVKVAQQNLEAKEEEINSLNDELSQENESYNERSENFNQENIQYHQYLNNVNSIAQEIKHREETYQKSEENIAENQKAYQENEQEIKKVLESNEIDEGELLAMYEEKENIEKAVNEAEKDYYDTRGKIDEAEKANKEIQQQKNNSDTVIMELHNSVNEAKMELQSAKERLSVEFEIDLDKLMNDGEGEEENAWEGMDEDKLREDLGKVKDKMNKIGPINPMAMEAYEEIKERHDFISREKEDLLNAKSSLNETITEIDTAAREAFMDAFKKIKENFVEVFRTLFTDQDDCDLKLSDPDNPLDASIQIMAKPKGKKPLSINQLSGGEKTLTATSLLFAIYLLKPAPFCIFDEVDAPLDDANIDKFNHIIKKFSENSQFIIVTHNKRTMANTDVIYGVTMIEQGVSKAVPVDLRELAD